MNYDEIIYQIDKMASGAMMFGYSALFWSMYTDTVRETANAIGPPLIMVVSIYLINKFIDQYLMP